MSSMLSLFDHTTALVSIAFPCYIKIGYPEYGWSPKKSKKWGRIDLNLVGLVKVDPFCS